MCIRDSSNINAEAGSPIEIAIGIIIAIIDIGPKPGSIPITVPIMHPETTMTKLKNVNAAVIPKYNPSNILANQCLN